MLENDIFENYRSSLYTSTLIFWELWSQSPFFCGRIATCTPCGLCLIHRTSVEIHFSGARLTQWSGTQISLPLMILEIHSDAQQHNICRSPRGLALSEAFTSHKKTLVSQERRLQSSNQEVVGWAGLAWDSPGWPGLAELGWGVRHAPP